MVFDGSDRGPRQLDTKHCRGIGARLHCVKKAVNWALRNIGKRNPKLNKPAIQTAQQIAHLDSKAARWIAADAIRELEGQAVKKRLVK
jgi:hypothetical protein